MKELTKKEASVTVGAINTTINMLSDLLMQNESIQEAINILESSREKIEKIYKEYE